MVFPAGVIPDESKAMSLLAPANAVAGMMPGGGLLPTPNPLATVSLKRFSIDVYLLNSLYCRFNHLCYFRWQGRRLEALELQIWIRLLPWEYRDLT